MPPRRKNLKRGKNGKKIVSKNNKKKMVLRRVIDKRTGKKVMFGTANKRIKKNGKVSDFKIPNGIYFDTSSKSFKKVGKNGFKSKYFRISKSKKTMNRTVLKGAYRQVDFFDSAELKANMSSRTKARLKAKRSKRRVFKNARVIKRNFINEGSNITSATDIYNFLKHKSGELDLELTRQGRNIKTNVKNARVVFKKDGQRQLSRQVSLDSLELFTEQLEAALRGDNLEGSDAVAEGFELDTDFFGLVNILIPNVSGGKNNKSFFKSKHFLCWNPENKDNFCLLYVLKHGTKNRRQLTSVISDINKKYKINITGEYPLVANEKLMTVLEDYFNTNIDIYEEDDEKFWKAYTSKSKYTSKVRVLSKDNHFVEIIDTKIVKKVYIKKKAPDFQPKKYIKKKAPDFQPKKYIKKIKVPKEKKVYIKKVKEPKKKRAKIKRNAFVKSNREPKPPMLIFFDIETIFDVEFENFFAPYSIGYYMTTDLEFNYTKEEHLEKCKTIYGRQCIRNFLKRMLKFDGEQKYDVKLIGFNSSRFDNFFLCEEMLRMGCDPKIWYVNNSILSFNIFGAKPIDLCRFLTCSLDKACKDFKTNPKKMPALVSHEDIQKKYEKFCKEDKPDDFIKWIKSNEKNDIYLKLDVLSLTDLFFKFYKVLGDLGINLLDKITIGQTAYNVWEVLTKNGEMKKDEEKWGIIPESDKGIIKVPWKEYIAENLETDIFFRSGLTAGRVQSYFKHFKYDDNVRMVDFTSLYPFVMKARKYPDCKYERTDSYQSGKLGFYRCDIIHQNMKWRNKDKINFKQETYDFTDECKYAPIVFPLRSSKKPLDWTYRGEQNNITLCSVDIECIRRNGGEVKTYEGIFWETCNDRIFGEYVRKFEDIKNQQDKYKVGLEKAIREKDTENIKKFEELYNPTLRNTAKLLLNSLSGKVIQKNYDTCFVDITLDSKARKFTEQVKEGTITTFSIESRTFGKGTLKTEHVFNDDKAKPSFLGCLIYAYARELMYETLLVSCLVIYEDTDSACLPLNEYERLMKDRPDLFDGKKFGNLDEEVGEATGIICLRPKCYFVNNPKVESLCKRKFKGVRKSDKWILLSEYKEKHPDLFRITKSGKIILTGDGKEVSEELDTELKPVLSNEMFETLYQRETIVVFQQQFRKVCKDKRIGIQMLYLRKIMKAAEESQEEEPED